MSEALKIAIKSLELIANVNAMDYEYQKEAKDALKSIKSALEAKDEPVAWMCADESLINKGYARFSHVCMGEWKIPVYTSPPQRAWIGLTADEMESLFQLATYMDETDHIHMLMMAEDKLKEKNQ